ncbi:carbohydrate sulfotransferase 1 isoform X2 [Hydra vulgaris]|uniref:Carbohydrate sulfotransferase 1 isoform X2 n=1 Tax=Hydra vulgaris TaxID=6087 RepID=A0ABM4CYV8_HYDVU
MRLRYIIAMIAVVIIYVILTIKVFNSYLNNLPKARESRYSPQKLLVLLSQPRSGSSFLGKVLSSSLRSVYFYEPLHNMDSLYNIDINFATSSQRQIYDKDAMDYLKNMFHCNFDRKEWIRINKSIFKSFHTLQTRKCEEKSPDVKIQFDHCNNFVMNSYHLQRECHQFNLIVKLLEMRVPEAVIENVDSIVSLDTNFRLLYLVRDPRASFWSLLKTGWIASSYKNISFQKYVPLRCQEMYRNFKLLAKQKYVTIIRYEDIIVNSGKALKDIYSYLDEETTSKVKSKISRLYCYTPVFNKMSNNNSYLNTTETQAETFLDNTENIVDQRKNYNCFSINKWRHKANLEFVKLVEKSCVNIMRALGYEQLGKKAKTLKDFSRSLIYPTFNI